MESTYVFIIDRFFCPRQVLSWNYTVSPFRTVEVCYLYWFPDGPGPTA